MAAMTIVRAVACATLAAACGLASAASLFKPVAVPKATRAPEMLLSAAPIAVDMDAIAAAQPGETLDVALPNGKAVALRIERTERHENGDVSWSGQVSDGGRTDLDAHGTSGVAGTYAEIATLDGTWGIVPGGAGHEWLFDQTAAEANLPPRVNRDDARVPANRPPTLAPKATCPTTAGMPTPQVTLDVLAVIAPDFVATHGGAAGAETRLNAVFSAMNAYNAASNIAITYRRVATMNVSYPAASATGDEDGAALDALTDNTGTFTNVEAIRNFYGADMVAFFRGPKSTSGNSISGIAWVTGDQGGALTSFDATHMYAVIGDWAFPSATVAAHELGHNLGNNHDRPNAGFGGGSTPYAYGHYVCGAGASSLCGQEGINNAGTGFGTIMSYVRPTVPKFANPNVTCRGTQANALSAACGVANQQDDARSTNCIRQTVAAFRNSWVGNCTNLAADADGDGIPDCIEAGSGRSASAKDNDVFGNALLFSAQQFRDLAGREAAADELNSWIGALGAIGRGQMIDNLLTSPAYQGGAAAVARLYFAYFLRVPDYGGLQFWIGQYNAGATLESISAQFAASAEFGTRYGALTNQQFVTLVYGNVLGRAPDASGLAYWTGQLASGARDRGSVMLGFSESPEYRTTIGNEAYVTLVFAGMLRRAPASAGFNAWVSSLDGGNPRVNLVNAVLGSAEYRKRLLP